MIKNNKRFEFKFNLVDEINVDDYLELLEVYFQFSNMSFCSLVIDKDDPSFDFRKYFPDVWEAYIGYSKMIVKNNFNIDAEKVAVVADFAIMPNNAIKYFEREMKFLDCVFNCFRLESDASLLIQLVDVLLGCVVYDFKIKSGFYKEDLKYPKTRLVVKLREYLKQESLAKSFTFENSNCFSVWKFEGEPK